LDLKDNCIVWMYSSDDASSDEIQSAVISADKWFLIISMTFYVRHVGVSVAGTP
jgi:hypothetical protein